MPRMGAGRHWHRARDVLMQRRGRVTTQLIFPKIQPQIFGGSFRHIPRNTTQYSTAQHLDLADDAIRRRLETHIPRYGSFSILLHFFCRIFRLDCLFLSFSCLLGPFGLVATQSVAPHSWIVEIRHRIRSPGNSKLLLVRPNFYAPAGTFEAAVTIQLGVEHGMRPGMGPCDARSSREVAVENDKRQWKRREGLFGSDADIPPNQTTALFLFRTLALALFFCSSSRLPSHFTRR
jgi:hypothetical protein